MPSSNPENPTESDISAPLKDDLENLTEDLNDNSNWVDDNSQTTQHLQTSNQYPNGKHITLT